LLDEADTLVQSSNQHFNGFHPEEAVVVTFENMTVSNSPFNGILRVSLGWEGGGGGIEHVYGTLS
jgi:hypothetical protein